MFDIGWSELVVIGVVALLVVGPKELPALLRTIGRYTGMIKRQANEFRSQFDEAMRETELDQLRKEVASLKHEAESTLRSAEQSVQTEFADAKSELDSVAAAAKVNGSEAGQAPAPGATAAPEALPQTESSAVLNGGAVNGYGGASEPSRAAESDQNVKSGA